MFPIVIPNIDLFANDWIIIEYFLEKSSVILLKTVTVILRDMVLRDY